MHNNMTSLVNVRHYRSIASLDQPNLLRIAFTYQLPGRQLMCNRYQKHRAQSLSVADMRREVQQEVFVVHVTTCRGVDHALIRVDHHFDDLAGGVRQAEAACHLLGRGRTELVEQHREIHPIAMSQRAPGALREHVVTLGPLVEAAEREEAVAIDGEIASSRCPWLPSDRLQFGNIADKESAHTQEVPRAPVRRARYVCH